MLFSCKNIVLTTRCLLRNRNVSSFLAANTADYERPTSIVLATSEGFSTEMWSSFVTFASKHGYNGMCLHARLLPSFEESANRLRSEIVEAKLTPPIMIAHSAATFVAQKYLESYALSGLVLVNPFPASKVRHHLSKWGEQEQLRLYDCLRNHSSNQSNKFTSTKDQEEEKLKLKLQFEAILANTTADDDYVNLERGSVPTMLVTSDGSTPLLSALQLDELIQLHAVEPEDVVHLGFSDRACGEPSISSGDTKHKNSLKGIPMIDHADEFNKRVMSWIENVV